MALYDDTLEIAKEYMGPAAKKYMTRRFKSMRIENPDEIEKEDLDMLATTIQATAKLYLNEQQVLNFKQDILALKKVKR